MGMQMHEFVKIKQDELDDLKNELAEYQKNEKILDKKLHDLKKEIEWYAYLLKVQKESFGQTGEWRVNHTNSREHFRTTGRWRKNNDVV